MSYGIQLSYALKGAQLGRNGAREIVAAQVPVQGIDWVSTTFLWASQGEGLKTYMIRRFLKLGLPKKVGI